ncbi:MAG: glycine/betaine ABC transporter substrate-binding protein [Bacilli bacterium]|jgi:osmoprotectant transport system substrate-binding protein/osmoprotectant transport system permease protein|nr:glycine/betaine ABC transporter substrate-binding protein [Bacilli bacterium]
MKKVLLSLGIICTLLVGVIGCSGSKDTNKDIVLLKGQFSEITIIMEMTKILIEDNTDLKVTYHDSMATVPAASALEKKEVDLYVTYDGTLLSTIMQSDPSKVPAKSTIFDYANELAKKRDLLIFNKFGFENTYALGIKEDYSKKNNINTISELVKYAPTLVFGAEHEFFDAEGSIRFKPLNEFYGLKWKDSKSLDLNLKYSAMDSGNINVTNVYSTDGLNVKSKLKVLVDDKGFFPEYNAGYEMRTDLFEKYKESAPNLKEVLSMLNGKITSEEMTKMNYEVDGLNKDVHEVAYAFLQSKGLVK